MIQARDIASEQDADGASKVAPSALAVFRLQHRSMIFPAAWRTVVT